MKLIHLISLNMMMFFGSFVESSTIEQWMTSHFLELEQNATNQEIIDPKEYNTLGVSYLNGFFQLTIEGAIYTIQIEVDPNKSCSYFKASHKLGNELGSGLLGMLYLNGLGCDENIELSKQLLEPVRLKYSDTASAYGIAVHKLMRTSSKHTNKVNTSFMLESLKKGAENNQIPALNALYQIYKEGIYTERNINLSEAYRTKAKELINQKLKINEAMRASQKRISLLNNTIKQESEVADRNKFLFSLGLLATTLYYSQNQYNAVNNCSIGCSPPSAVDLLNWGIL